MVVWGGRCSSKELFDQTRLTEAATLAHRPIREQTDLGSVPFNSSLDSSFHIHSTTKLSQKAHVKQQLLSADTYFSWIWIDGTKQFNPSPKKQTHSGCCKVPRRGPSVSHLRARRGRRTTPSHRWRRIHKTRRSSAPQTAGFLVFLKPKWTLWEIKRGPFAGGGNRIITSTFARSSLSTCKSNFLEAKRGNQPRGRWAKDRRGLDSPGRWFYRSKALWKFPKCVARDADFPSVVIRPWSTLISDSNSKWFFLPAVFLQRKTCLRLRNVGGSSVYLLKRVSAANMDEPFCTSPFSFTDTKYRKDVFAPWRSWWNVSSNPNSVLKVDGKRGLGLSASDCVSLSAQPIKADGSAPQRRVFLVASRCSWGVSFIFLWLSKSFEGPCGCGFRDLSIKVDELIDWWSIK